MRMDEMNKLFEEQGFTVERKWESEHNWYRFTISKDGKYQVGIYTYPVGAHGHAANEHQRAFVEKLIMDFEKSFDAKILMNSIYGRNAYRNDAMCAYLLSVGGFEKCLKNKDEEMWTKMNPWITTNFKIKNVIFNDPATIVMWTDGTKTVVKCQDDDVFDPEKGLAMAISKKALGNKGNYCNELKKWLPKEEEAEVQEFNFIGNVESITKLNDGISFECTLDGSIAEKFKAGLDSLKRKMNIHSPSETIIGMNTKSNDPVRKAYDILIDCRDNGVAFDIDTVIGHLGEALGD